MLEGKVIFELNLEGCAAHNQEGGMAIQAGTGMGKVRFRKMEDPCVEAQKPKSPGSHSESKSGITYCSKGACSPMV